MKVQIVKLVMMVAILLVAALPARAQGRDPFPLPPPEPVGVCSVFGTCTLVCHVPERAGRHWMWIKDEDLERWLLEHPADYAYDGELHASCANSAWFPFVDREADPLDR